MIPRRPLAILAIATGFFALATATPKAADGPLAAFAGNWSGSGTITVKDGGRERIRCRGGNTASGNSLSLGLKCASDSYKFELASDITSSGNAISGSWSEASRGVYGQLAGKINGSHIQAEATAAGFNASLSIQARGNSLAVTIRSPGSEISEVSVSLGCAASAASSQGTESIAPFTIKSDLVDPAGQGKLCSRPRPSV